MEKIAIVVDSNSGITQEQGKEMGIQVLPMPFFIDGELYHEGINLTHDQFYERMDAGADISTSQPAPADVTDLWDELLKSYEAVVYIPMSSGLSSSCESATALALDYEGQVFVVNNQRISVTQKQSAFDALELRAAGKSAAQIKSILEDEKFESSIYITVDTLKYLKKGGRVTPTAAAIGTVLNVKPVLQIQGEKLDSFAKVRGFKQAKKVMLDAIEQDLQMRFKGKKMHMQAAYTCSDEDAQEWKRMIEERFPETTVSMDRLSLSIACHIGPGSLAVACSKAV